MNVELYEMIIKLFAIVGIATVVTGCLWLISDGLKLFKPKERIVIHFRNGRKIKFKYNQNIAFLLRRNSGRILLELDCKRNIKKNFHIETSNIDYWEEVLVKEEAL